MSKILMIRTYYHAVTSVNYNYRKNISSLHFSLFYKYNNWLNTLNFKLYIELPSHI